MSSSTGNGGDVVALTPGEEGILVAIRMRPFNNKESNTDTRSWRVLPKYNSVAQCTNEGRPLQERIINRTFFSYDKAFAESSTTQQVYEATSQGIVNSVAAEGKNGTIFAYGQTSSGKTYTMQGSGTIQEGASAENNNSNATGGIVHMAASDIFNHIEKEPERVFLVRVSFIEIYNEEVRDLLVSGDSASLTIREDKRRGVFVNSNETIVTSMNSLLSVLFAGEKNRSVAATGMNERSSRSHTIFRITVESRLKEDGKDDEEEEEDSDDDEDAIMRGDVHEKRDAVRVSTLNLVDLAGSESVRHTGNTGERQKEGGKINQSLLTLSRVIGSLGQNATHVNFRDSKLTRILQPSLSGNARMAIICCATPSAMYLEETRSTLQFASRAKLVKTRAQVNEVMDDRSLIKKLQRELKEARKGGPDSQTMEQMKALEQKAASAEVANRKAEEDVKRMKELILKGGVLPGSNMNVANSSAESLFVYNDNDETIKTGADKFSLSSKSSNARSKRRYSDGVVNETENGNPQQLASFSSPVKGGNVSKKHAQTEMKPKKVKPTAHIQPSDMTDDIDIGLLREALAAKSAQAASLKAKLASATEKLQQEHGEKEMLRLAKQDLESQVSTLASDKEFCVTEQDVLMADKENVITSSLEKIETMLEERKQHASTVSELQAMVESLQSQMSEKNKEQEEMTEKYTELEGKLETVNSSNTQLTDQVTILEGEKVDTAKALSEKEAALEVAESTITALKEESSSSTSQLSEELVELRSSKTAAEERISALESTLESEQASLAAALAEVENKLEAAVNSNTQMNDQLVSLQTCNDLLSGEVSELRESKTAVEGELASSKLAVQDMGNQLEVAEEDIVRLSKEINAATESVEELQSNLADATKQKEEQATALQDATQTLQSVTDEKDTLSCQLTELQTKYDSIQSNSSKAEDELREGISNLESSVQQKDQEITVLNETITSSNLQIESLGNEVTTLTSERDELLTKLDTTSQELSSVQESASSNSSKIEELESNIVEVSTERDSALEQVKELTLEVESKNEAMEVLQTEKDKLSADMEMAETNHSEAVEQKSQEIDALKLQVSDATSQKDELVLQLESSASNLAAAQEEAQGLTSKITQLESSVESLTTERDAANDRVTEMMSGNKDVEAALASLTSEKDELASCLEKTKADVVRVETEKEDVVVQLNGLQESIDSLQTQAEVFKSENEELKSQFDASSTALDEMKNVAEERDNLVVKIEEVTTELSTLQSSMEALTAERDNAEAKLTELSSGQSKSAEDQSVLQAEKEELEAKVQEYATKLDSEKEEAQTKIDGLNATVSELQSQHESLVNDLSEAEAKFKALESEKEQMQIAAEEKVKSSADEISQLNEQLSTLSEQVSAAAAANNKESDVGNNSEVIETLEKEIVELKLLLSSANASVDEARSAALSADQELEEKELQLENALSSVAEHEEARRIAEDKLRLAELSPRNSPARTDSEEELLRDMEVLMGEKLDAESRLEQELGRRKVVVEDIKRSCEEDKHQLIKEAEEKMVSLRDEIAQLKSDLSRVESDCYTMKDENTDLQDKITRIEAKSTDSESIVTSIKDELSKEQKEKEELQQKLNTLEEQSAAFREQVFAAKATFEADAQARLSEVEEQLNEALSQLTKSKNDAKLSLDTIGELNNDIEVYKRELDSLKGVASNENEMELSQVRESLAQTKLDLSHSKADCLSIKQDLDAAKEKIASVKRHEHEKQQKFASRAKEAIETLKEKLAKAESAQSSSLGRIQEEDLQAEVTELKSTLREKDERIKKLEKSKITKSQIANIQKLKDERSQFLAEAKEAKARVEELENSKPRRGGLRERADTSADLSQEVEKVRDDLKQCENKLRKYVQHSERLENDRKGVLAAISSANVGDITGDGIVEMVESLCEKLTSVEEECEELANSQGKAAEYLTELDSLKEKYSLLEMEVQTYEENDTKLTSALSECKANLKRATEKIAQLMTDKESLKAMAESAKGNISELQAERRRQMQYLENENLQLGDELKRTKKELSQAKSELDVVQKDILNGNDETEELQGLSNLLSSSKRPPTDSASKCFPPSGNKGIPPSGLSSSRKRCPDSPPVEHSKENMLNKKQKTLSAAKSPFSSAKKKKNPFSSVKKAARSAQRTLSSSSTPTKHYQLGDNEPTADITGECQQS